MVATFQTRAFAEVSGLAGSWSIHRHLHDRRRATTYLFSGEVVISPAPEGGLTWHEEGSMSCGPVVLEASRTNRLVPDGGWLRIELPDGGLLGALDLGRGLGRLHHDCGEDRYRGAVALRASTWWWRWRCRGPGKDYVTTTLVRRRTS